MKYSRIPEMAALHGGAYLIRIPLETDVPVTKRVLRLIDCEAFRRLRHISQLGLVGLVYPGAVHTRHEHSLGVYRNALLYLDRLGAEPHFTDYISEHQATVFILAALLHDIGHWPFCHAIEDLRLPGIEKHEAIARKILESDEIKQCLRDDWDCEPTEIADLLDPQSGSQVNMILSSMLSGPIDIDKMDYLDRDSLHAGVPYGRNFDRQRLIRCLCVDHTKGRIAIEEKARTAAEMMVFARYVMFSEVYWHHAVRSATAMVQRIVHRLAFRAGAIDAMFFMSEPDAIAFLRDETQSLDEHALWTGLFGPRRVLYKRLAQFHFMENPEMHALLARRPYTELVELSTRLADWFARSLRIPILPHEVLVDAPPVKLEVQFDLSMRSKSGQFRALGDLSPVVKTLATQQFDDTVKRVRIFIAPRWQTAMRDVNIHRALAETS